MERKNKKTLILLLILLLVFIFTFVRALKPVKPKTVGIAPNKSIQSEILSLSNEEVFDFQQMDLSVSRLNSVIKSLEQQKEEDIVAIDVKRNPFTVQQESKLIPGRTSETFSILRQDFVEAPDFKVSGIVYDKEKPMIIIGDEVKAENETKNGYTIKKILSDRVVLKRDNKEFVLYVGSSEFKNLTESIITSDGTPVGDTGLFVRNTVPAFLSKNSISETTQESSIMEQNIKVGDGKRINTLALQNNESKKILTVQIASFSKNRKNQAIEFAKKIMVDGHENVRVECIRDMYTVRVGIAQKKDDLVQLYEELKKYSETSFIRSAYLIEKRIVYPPNINL
ncbi:MAG: hypothetical protein N2115_01075 [bacterium]|nr:hypothetical protein [bacterium]